MGNYNSDQKNARFYGLKLSRNTDADLVDWLDSQESIQGYLKQLIREDMKKGENSMTINEFVQNLWESCPVTPEKIDLGTAETDLKNFAADGWDLPDGITPETYMDAWNALIE